MDISTPQASIIDEIPVYGSSLPVPNVQEMVKNDPSTVPVRYIRHPQDMPKFADIITPLSSDVPLIDFSLLLERQEEELKKLDKACKEWGFFQVINHGIEKYLLQKMKDDAALFLNLPLEEKNKFSMPQNDVQGYGHSFVASEAQKLDWYDTLALVVFPSKFRRYEVWPTKPEDFKDIMEKYSSEVRRVGKELIASISLNMELDSKTLLGLHRDLIQALRLNYYPPCSKPDQVLGLSPHSDASTITILFQADDITGLEIRHNGQWVPIKPIPDALVVNIGDVLEIWSNGKYKSIEHRAVTNQDKARMTFASFIYPPDDLEIEPLDNMVDTQGELKMYKKVTFGQFLREYMKGKLEGKAHIEREKLELEV